MTTPYDPMGMKPSMSYGQYLQPYKSVAQFIMEIGYGDEDATSTKPMTQPTTPTANRMGSGYSSMTSIPTPPSEGVHGIDKIQSDNSSNQIINQISMPSGNDSNQTMPNSSCHQRRRKPRRIR